ncbi:hypothetical protein ACFWN1_05710 [Streptomyces sp. NPDC058459]|uniref:hypothetical protein n=1 Tax=Streptomyces sp. NPDC058459 TaxID=3346508 RepID=UPI00365B176F
MTAPFPGLRPAYVAGAVFLTALAYTSVQHGAHGYAAALCCTAALLLTAARRETLAARQARTVAVRAERAARARARALADDQQLADVYARGWLDLHASCCLTAWHTGGTDHDTRHCTRKDTNR